MQTELCPNCGKKIMSGELEGGCSNCGYKIDDIDDEENDDDYDDDYRDDYTF